MPGSLGGAVWYSSKEYKYETRMLDLNPGSAICHFVAGYSVQVTPWSLLSSFCRRGNYQSLPHKPYKFVVRINSVKMCKMFRTVPRFHRRHLITAICRRMFLKFFIFRQYNSYRGLIQLLPFKKGRAPENPLNNQKHFTETQFQNHRM